MTLEEKVREVVQKNIPEGCYLEVCENRVMGSTWLKIMFAACDKDMHVRGQKPQVVSLRLDIEDLELDVQVWGGNGGNRIYRQVDVNKPEEKFYAMIGIKIPFRRPQKNEKSVLAAIEKFAQNWVKAIKENKAVLMYQNVCKYENF